MMDIVIVKDCCFNGDVRHCGHTLNKLCIKSDLIGMNAGSRVVVDIFLRKDKLWDKRLFETTLWIDVNAFAIINILDVMGYC